MKRKTFTSILLALAVTAIFAVTGYSQTKKAYIKAAETAAEAHDHYSEMVYYQNVLEFEEDDIDFLYKTAEAARKINALTKAAEYYKRVIELDENNAYPEATYHLARMQQKLGQYADAQSNYQIFLTEYEGSNSNLKARAEKELSASEWAEDYSQQLWEEFQIEHLSSNINTPYSEFGATPMGDSLYFSSLRFEIEDDTYDPDRLLTGLLMSEDMGVGEKLGEEINLKNTHTAHSAFTREGDRMYFTICEYGLPDSIRCDLYYRDLGDAGWGDAVAISSVNGAGYTSTQPNVGYDDDNGVAYLYFSSDRPGGKGGLDIYRSAITESGFGEIENIAGVNTAYNEVTPFYHSPTRTLYFSSNGRKTLGGLDVFKSSMRSGSAGVVQHLGAPLNGSYHDLYYSLNEKGDVAYFSSNRTESFYLVDDIEACCYDIYKVDILPFANLIAQTFEAQTLDSLYGTKIRVINLTTGEEMIAMDDELASGVFPLARDNEYMIIASKENYISDTVRFNTLDIQSLDDIVKKLYLKTDILYLDAFTFDDRTKEALRGATVTLYDLDDPDADPIIVTNFDANDFHFELERGKRYRITATRKGYSSETVIIDTNDHKDKSRIRQDLFLKIGELDDFLPLVLYFDNDHPNPNTYVDDTELQYTETFPPYFARKQTFIDRFTQPLAGVERDEKARQLNSFFDTEVKKGNDDLLVFMEVLEAHLAQGDKVSIYLKGYTSPRSTRFYNLALGNRRVNSVRNDLQAYAGGKLQGYLSSGQLTVEQKSFGETTAPRGISSSIPNERLSIYSYEASKERRVEIVQIEIN